MPVSYCEIHDNPYSTEACVVDLWAEIEAGRAPTFRNGIGRFE